MKFKDIFFSKEERYSIGIEQDSGKYYLSIPVTTGIVDYEEYYEISEADYKKYISHPALAVKLAKKCKRRENDAFLMIKPGTNRGVAS